MEKRTTEAEMQASFRQFEDWQKKIYKKGMFLIISISIISAIFSIIPVILSTTFVRLAFGFIGFVFSLLLLTGFSVFRYLLSLINFVLAFSVLGLFLIFTLDPTGAPWYQSLILFIILVYFVWSSAVLLTNKSISEYLYMRKNKKDMRF